MNPTSLVRTVARWSADTIVAVALSTALLLAWCLASVNLAVGVIGLLEKRISSVALSLASVAFEVTLCVALARIGRKYTRVARAVTAGLLGSIALLPYLHTTTLEWLGEVRVGGFGDFVYGITPEAFYPFALGLLRRSNALVGVAFVAAAALLGHLAAMPLWRERLRARASQVALALVAVVVAWSASHALTRPPIERWLTTFPVVARVPLREVAIDPRRDLDDFGPDVPRPDRTRLPGGVELLRRSLPHADGTIVVDVSAPPLTRPDGSELPANALPLRCSPDATLMLRRVPDEPSLRLLSCGDDPVSRREGSSMIRGETSVIEVHYWELKLRNVHMLRRVAPPTPWLFVGALGLVLAMIALRARRSRASTRSESTPYRTAALDDRSRDRDEPREAVLRAAVIAGAAHCAAPLILALWTRAM